MLYAQDLLHLAVGARHLRENGAQKTIGLFVICGNAQ
jgi:hypothetical protein